jgi:hypothetical protein
MVKLHSTCDGKRLKLSEAVDNPLPVPSPTLVKGTAGCTDHTLFTRPAHAARPTNDSIPISGGAPSAAMPHQMQNDAAIA